jgi:hypothetical protein
MQLILFRMSKHLLILNLSRDSQVVYNRFSVYTSAVKLPTIANEKISFEVKFVQNQLSNNVKEYIQSQL